MEDKDFVGKTIKEITCGTSYCDIEFTDGSTMEITYSQRGYYGAYCSLDYEFEGPEDTDSTE